ncbi:DUF6531 domain-containing protein [Streptomyces sp. NPDC008092]|uniref:DUF6531 domain-containing protein n=1 Tax=Streptomyces sp. NPDC008092 TaxID=3364808 RepID=UPI0036E224B3
MTLSERREQVKQSRDGLSPMGKFRNSHGKGPGKPTRKPHSRPQKLPKQGPAAKPSAMSGATTLAAATTADPAWVSSTAVAYPDSLTIGGYLQFAAGTTASSYSGLWMYLLDENGNYVYQHEVKKATDNPVGNTPDNGAWCYGWWPADSHPADQCFWWMSNKLGGLLQDGKKYYAYFFMTGADGTYSPRGTTSPLVTAFYTPGIPGAQAGICSCYGQAHRADPVDTATGMFYERLTDAKMTGVGTQVSLDRTYRSDSATSGLLGPGWATPFDSKLTVSSGSVTYQADDGASFVFTQASDGTYTTPAASTAKLAKSGSTYTLTTPDQTRRTFSGSGQLTSVVDKAGQGLTLTYTSGKLSSVKDAAGRTTGFTFNADGLLSKVDLPDTTSVSYGYDGGLLTSVTDPAGRTSHYAYNADKRLSSYTDPAGGTVSNTYYPDGRIKTQTDQNDKTTDFTWDDTDDSSHESYTTAPDGGVWTDLYSGNVLMESIDPYGKTVSYDYDQKLRPVDITDQRGNTTSMTYDSAGHMLSRSAPSSLGYSESWTYDSAGNVKSHTDGRTYTTSYGYNASNQLTTSTDPMGGKTSYTYTALGALHTVTTPRGNQTTYDYDSAGNRTSVTTPLGEKTTFTYDAAGRILTRTSPRGNVSGADPAAYTTNYAYDGRGLLKSVTDPLNRTTTYEYNGAEQLKSVEDPSGNFTRYEYDDAGNLTKTTDALNKSIIRTFDTYGNVTSETDPLQNKTVWNYDKLGRLSSTVSARGNLPGANPVTYTTSYEYDDAGNRTKVTDPTGAYVTTDYDAVNRPVKVTDALKKPTLYEYDANDNVTKVTDPYTKSVSSTYDKNNRLHTTTDQLTKTTTYDYDADGNMLSTTSPLGYEESWTYDADGRLSSATDPRGNVAGATPDDYTTWYEYNPDGYQKTVTDSYGATTNAYYDANGNVTRVNDADDRVTTYGYDLLDRLTKVSAFDGGSTVYGYDEVGDLKTRTDANNHVTTYDYDDDHRLHSVTDPLNRATTYSYDADGNQNGTTTPRGTTTLTYDARNLLAKTDYSDSTPDVSYGYDAAGHMLSRTLGDGNAIGYTYDDDGRAKTMTADSKTTSYAYDAAGNLTTTTLPDTETETRQYDHDGRLTAVTSAKSGTTVTSTSLALSPGGLPVREYVSRAGIGSGGWDLTYDDVGRLASGCAPQPTDVGCPAARATTYTYDKVGNRLTSTLGTTSTSYGYDDADELKSTTTGSTTTAFSYDGEGNQTKAGADTYTYDLAGQVSAATIAGNNYTYTHDGAGNQLTTSKAGTVQGRLDWDLSASVPQLATEYDSAGAIKQSYRYDPLGQPAATETASGALFYYHHDTQGSPVDVTGSTGTLYQRWTYDPYGTRTLNTVTAGAPASTPGYTGARYEPTTGNLDLHARQYTPTTGRFTSTDPATPDRNSAYTSAYAYANDAPTLYTDPSGMTPQGSGDGHVHSVGEGLKVFGDGFLEGLKSPFDFLGDAYDAVTGANGGAGAFLDKYLPVRPAYRLYRAEYMLRQQGCDELADLYGAAADELAQQLGVTVIGGLSGWRRGAYESETSILESGGIAPRNAKGKYARRNGEEGRDGSNDELTTWENLELDGATVIRKEVAVKVPGFKVRKFDGLVKINGQWYGIETKGATAKRNPDQKKFDDWLNTPGNTVTTKDGIKLVGVFDSWIPPGSMKSREHLDN